MKKNKLYLVLLLFFIGAAGFVVLKFQADANAKKMLTYELLERKGPLAKSDEWAVTQQAAAQMMAAIKAKPGESKPKIALANLYIMEARATGNYIYYDKAAMKYVEDVLVKDPNNFDALTLKSLLFLSQHHFADGLGIARRAEKINPYNAFLQGVMVDGHIEMGNYDSAVLSAEKMMEIRPDLRSYARVSYIREIFGDYPGAITAMEMAIDAGVPGDEATEWSRVQLGHLLEHTGNLITAAMNYETALNYRPGFVPAMAGMARIALASKAYKIAIDWYCKADSLASDFSYKEELVEVYQLAGQWEKATSTAKSVIAAMEQNARAAATDETIGHYADRELAFAWLRINKYDKALEHALADYNRRPKNIEVNETLAWVYYQKGEYAKALPYIREALKTNSKNPQMLCRAGLILAKNGEKEKAKDLLTGVLSKGSNLPEMLKLISEQALKTI